MKNSGIEWIGEIPNDWKSINFGNVLKEHKMPNRELNTHSLQFKFGTIVRKNEREITPELIEMLSNYNVVEPNNIMINGLNLAFDFTTQRVAIVKEKGVITSTYIAIMPTTTYCPQYATYLLKSYDNQKVFHALGRGLRCMLSYDILKREKVLYPSLYIQQKIADYLDKKCAAVDRLIENQRAQIEKLKQFKQSLITEVVTKGLDKTVPTKDSGVEWIGEMPEHWKATATKFIFKIFSGATPKSEIAENWDGTIVWITPADYKTDDVYVSRGRRNISEQGFRSCSASMIPKNSIVFSKRAPIGAVAINSVDLCTNQGCLSCVNKRDDFVDVKFIYYVMAIATEQYELLGSGTTFKEISVTSFANFLLPIPSVKEQQAIVSYLDTKCSQIDRLIALKQEKIEKLTDYKKSLIYEYVTGKKQV